MLDTATQTIADDTAMLVAQDPHDLPDVLLLESTQALLRLQRQLDGVLCRRLQVIDNRDATTTECGRSTRAWLVEDQLLSRADAGARMAVARTVVTRPAILGAMLTGEASLDHTKLIVGFLGKLKDPDTKDHAEKLLVEAATFTDPTTLCRNLNELADRLNLDETAEGRAVRKREGRYLSLRDTIDQMVSVSGMLDRVGATILRKALYPLAVKAGDIDERTPAQRHADALVELARLAMNTGQLPDTAAEPTQIVVTTPLEDLARQLGLNDTGSDTDTGTATLDGTPITPNTARMLACDAGIIPAVLRGASETLDLGRSTRTWTRAQRRAAKLRANGHCESPKCQASIQRCDLHHQHHWAHGGKTDLNNAIYLCTYHHWLVHHTPWQITRNKAGQVQIRRT
ncbi:MAG TPA: DUF222 domain-containing protein [Mycobacteriales bacterium]|nr:DUF222 domain-containing protein [Mycobacteriales bacterium]